jgi:hypothetical protein
VTPLELPLFVRSANRRVELVRRSVAGLVNLITTARREVPLIGPLLKGPKGSEE